MVTFWRTFHHGDKISPAWWGWGMYALLLSPCLPSQTKLWSTLQMRGHFSSTLFSTILWLNSKLFTVYGHSSEPTPFFSITTLFGSSRSTVYCKAKEITGLSENFRQILWTCQLTQSFLPPPFPLYTSIILCLYGSLESFIHMVP